ncbi:MarR family transcriptional regulator [Actinomycetospora chiangmaiensis]|uniref:MarR family transcriptional regulator n=1 Tax=Actinomycetospora chiangmaiensis TaxID=402650 RepID=UPI00035C9F47|nr:MarR family transcriptional regulator [Actinomycetospora chiangmaiensis]
MLDVVTDDHTERKAAVEAATEELTALVVDHLVPVVHRFRIATARRLELGLPELLCLDLLRHLGPLPSGTIGERVGLTRSTVSKMLRRLEDGGHVRREASAGHRQGVEVWLVPHEERDRIVASFRTAVRDLVRATVTTYGLYRPDRRARAAGQLLHLVHALHLVASSEADRAWWRAAIVRRRRARRAKGLP